MHDVVNAIPGSGRNQKEAAPAASAPVAPEEPAAPAEARIVSDSRSREKVVPLDWPVEFGGKVYDHLTIKRLSGRDLMEFRRGASEETADEDMFARMAGVPRQVIDALDADDFVGVAETCTDFLPRRLLEAAERIGATGPDTPQM